MTYKVCWRIEQQPSKNDITAITIVIITTVTTVASITTLTPSMTTTLKQHCHYNVVMMFFNFNNH